MANGILQRLPNILPLLQQGVAAEGQLETLHGTFASLQPENPSSPIAPVGSALVGLRARLDIDVSGLSKKLPATIDVIQNAVPPSALEYVRSIEDAYSAVQFFLQDNPLAREVAAGSSLRDVALAVIEEALDLFNQRVAQLGENLIDPTTVAQIRNAFATIEEFRSNFPANRDEFLPFLTNHLLGVRPDLLREPLEHLDASYALLAPLDEEALDQTLDPAREALAEAFDGLVVALEGFDPAEATAYAELQIHLGEVETAINSTVGAVTPVYQQLQTLVESHAWDDIFSTYRTLLQAITIDRPFTMDTVVDEIAGVLEELLAKFYMTFGAEDLTNRIDALALDIRDTFTTSALGQVRQTITAFLEDIRTTIEGVPTEEIQHAVESMLERVGQELEALGITHIKEDISTALDEVQSFVVNNINAALTDDVKSALELLLANVRSLGLDTLIAQLRAAVNQLNSLISELETALNGHMDGLRTFASQLDQLSFKALSDEVIGQIDEIRTRLREINPNSLSDVEKLALRTALAVLEQIDLESQIISVLKREYGVAEDQVKGLLNDITAALERLREAFDAFNPDRVLGPVNEGLKLASEGVRQLNGQALLHPLQAQVDQFVQELEKLSPGQMLDPLQGPYRSMMQVVNRLDPEQWTAPLEALYQQIDQLIDHVDVTPLFDELDRLQKELLVNVRTALLGALDNLTLPEPLNAFFADIRSILESITDSVFGDPDIELRQISAELNTQLSLGSLSKPLDDAFDRLIQMVESVPQDELTDAVNTMREGIGVGLDILDPDAVIRHFREAQARLVELDPRVLLGIPLALPDLKLTFEVEAEAAPPERQDDVIAVSARFDAVFSLVATDGDADLIRPLIEAHEALSDALRRRINTLDASGANEAYTELRGNLDHVLPPFLHSPAPLTYADVMTSLYTMRPQVKFSKVEEVLERFLQQIRLLQGALEPAIDNFFDGIREVLLLVNPLELKDAVEDVYGAIRERVRILDPDALASSIRDNFFAPVTGALQAIDPATIKRDIDENYQEALAAVSTTVRQVLKDISDVLDTNLAAIREKIQGLLADVQATIDSAGKEVKNVVNRLEQLVFQELLGKLKQVIDNLGVSFDKELDRVRNAFDEMLAAIPVGVSSTASGRSTV